MLFSFFIWCHQNSHLGNYWFFGFSSFIRYILQLLNTFIHTNFWFKSMFDAGKALMWVKNIADFLRFWYLNIPCLRRNITYSSCDFLKRSNKFTHMTDCFYWFLAAMFVPLKGTPNIYKTLFFPNFLRIKITLPRRDSWQGFLYINLLSFPTFWTFSIYGFHFCFWWCDSQNKEFIQCNYHYFCFKWGPYFEILIFCMHALLLQSKPMYILRVLWHHWLITCQSPCHVMCTCFPVMSYTWVCPGQFPSDITG